MVRLRLSHSLMIGWLVTLLMPSVILADSSVGVDKQQVVSIALIIDDLGNQQTLGERAVDLPGAVTCAFLPQTPFAWNLATKAHQLNKEVMLHQPMESDSGKPLGQGALSLNMSKDQFLHTLELNFLSIPYLVGVNNHMGSLLTRDPTAMGWLMHELHLRGFYFIDSRTTVATVAERVAASNYIASARRDVFLDNEPQEDKVRRQLEKLVALAQKRGSAIGIGHPYPATLSVLREELPKLKQRGIALVPVSQILQDREKICLHNKDGIKNTQAIPDSAEPAEHGVSINLK
jgi:uncharacterized protein